MGKVLIEKVWKEARKATKESLRKPITAPLAKSCPKCGWGPGEAAADAIMRKVGKKNRLFCPEHPQERLRR
jgi:hypothetical protein